MEKIININFQSRVIPIEESAYDALQLYTEGLRRHFAAEESSEEIVSDIENRLAELLMNKLKQGAKCITKGDLDAVIDSIGRIEDIKAAEGEETQQKNNNSTASGTRESFSYSNRFARNADDKVIAGVCSGIAARLNVDPVVVRIAFVLLFGALFWIYILLWIIVPLESIKSNVTRRLFRNPDNKMIAGVCGGLGAYFRMDPWKVRLIFVLPFILGSMFSSFDFYSWHSFWGPAFFTGSFGGTFLVLYIILWIAIPFASTSTDRMEMRGEKIDINSIKAATQARSSEPVQQRRSSGSGLGRVIGILFKAFFLLIAGSVALGLFAALTGLVVAGSATMPYTNFFLQGWDQYALLWTGIGLTLGIPVLALIVWMIRLITGRRHKRHYFGYVFAGMWIIGLFCLLSMTGAIMNNFATKAVVEEQVAIQQPSSGLMYISVNSLGGPAHSARYRRWFGEWDDDNDAFRIVNNDSLWLNTVKVNIEQSPDTLFHVYESRSSRGNSTQKAREFASHFTFPIRQSDSILSLPKGFTISSADKFRNQQVLVTVEVPLGKTVHVSRDINEYSWFTISKRGRGIYYTNHWSDGYKYGTDRQYVMTASGLKRLNDTVDVIEREEDWEP